MLHSLQREQTQKAAAKTTGHSNQIQNGCQIKKNLIQPLRIPATLSLHCCDCRSLRLGSGCLSSRLLQIEIMITAIVNLQRQHLCGLVFSKWHFTEIVQALTVCSLLFLFFILFLLLSFIFVFAHLSSFLPLLLSSFSKHLFFPHFPPFWSLLYFFFLCSLLPTSFVSSPCYFTLFPLFHFSPFLPLFPFFSSLFIKLSAPPPFCPMRNFHWTRMCPKHIHILLYNKGLHD